MAQALQSAWLQFMSVASTTDPTIATLHEIQAAINRIEVRDDHEIEISKRRQEIEDLRRQLRPSSRNHKTTDNQPTCYRFHQVGHISRFFHHPPLSQPSGYHTRIPQRPDTPTPHYQGNTFHPTNTLAPMREQATFSASRDPLQYDELKTFHTSNTLSPHTKNPHGKSRPNIKTQIAI